MRWAIYPRSSPALRSWVLGWRSTRCSAVGCARARCRCTPAKPNRPGPAPMCRRCWTVCTSPTVSARESTGSSTGSPRRGAAGAAPSARPDRVFDRLARAEAAVHGIEPALVHFHEVGAVYAIVDVVGTCLGFQALGLDRLTVGRVALGGGRTTGRHGEVPVPGPAVLKLLESAQLQAHGGSDDVELATPTGVALLAELADGSGALPPVVVAATGTGAGGRNLPDRPNVVRLVVGDAVTHADEADQWLLVEANVDDLDPRLWPRVIEALLAAGAADAWLTPILMKKGRPAHT